MPQELEEKAQHLMEETDSDSRTRTYVGVMDGILTAVLVCFAIFQVWANLTGTLGAVKLRASHVMVLLPLAFLLYPTYRKAVGCPHGMCCSVLQPYSVLPIFCAGMTALHEPAV